MSQVNGTFEVALTPLADAAETAVISRMAIDKRFHGPLDGRSEGQMLATRTPVDGSAGYVALERVTATLEGRTGGFTLQHSGTMNRGAATLQLTVVPDSGTEGLAGIDGRMAITIADGTHFYEFDYTFDDGD
ncbi:hypothetical protein N800_14865 [Lysobacter daejeonensis GH1-9]|uniref:DUF3224 domain-containing protein n=1 Tax=Lysobacter daejeonensis GH1-9 TaxID=1385517 RepID=A0A0A0F1G9_9GAMM|nr:DUF3224 domain-containing protein [Lysobacter daejeonensis]KGM55247.1 hypothetical protein N800_14865 [Lysobacter daejeonensis GH1-9]